MALFADLDMPRILVGAGSGGGRVLNQHFLLDMGTPRVLGYYRYIRAVRVWNGPLTG